MSQKDINRFWAGVDKTDNCWEWRRGLCVGYGMIRINFHQYLAHRVAYELCVGSIPKGMHLDHICHNRKCVNPGHLRLATQAQNCKNRGKNKNNTSGFKGVYRSRNKWLAQISISGKRKHLGYFETPEEAAVAYDKAAENAWGEFALTNKMLKKNLREP